MSPTPDPAIWLLPFSSTDPNAVNGDGRPWGDGTSMAARAKARNPPYDVNCRVTTYIGGFAAMNQILKVLTQTIIDGQTRTDLQPGNRGHVYITDWRLNSQRDLSSTNSWGTQPWHSPTDAAAADQTALGLILKLMQAGVRVRILLWLPSLTTQAGATPAHTEDHYFIARAVAAQSVLLDAQWKLTDPIGIVGLDSRTAEGSVAGTHHQKTIVVRGPTQDIAFCGGVDLAFTRRDAPLDLGAYDATKTRFLDGDWQSAGGFPALAPWPQAHTTWPPEAEPANTMATRYAAMAPLDLPTDRPPTDLPTADDAGRNIYGIAYHIWHDQHLMLEGPIVQTLEDQFAERWQDASRAYTLDKPKHVLPDQIIFSSAAAFDATSGVINPLPASTQVNPVAGASSIVQMLRTIPWRFLRKRPPFTRAEFTVMGAVARAVSAAQQLVWIFDQYFWSEPLARLLNHRVAAAGSQLYVIVVLPPYADSNFNVIHEARRRALTALSDGAPTGRIGVYNLWDPRGQGRGIYVHAKAQTYDGSLLICGSANMNRRSFACDSEIACGVLDSAVVADHQHRLWELLFNAVTAKIASSATTETATSLASWPAGLDLNQAGAGATFFSAFTAAAQDPMAYLRPDPWAQASPVLTNGVPLPRSNDLKTDAEIDRACDPTSLSRVMEKEVRDAGSTKSRPVRLDDVVSRIETCVVGPKGKTVTPWRKSSHGL